MMMDSQSCDAASQSQPKINIPPNISFLNIKILVVDEDPTCLAVVTGLLRRCSLSEDDKLKCTITAIKSPLEALKELREKDFDLIIMNLHMHEVDGNKFLKQVTQETKLHVIVMAAYDDDQLMLKTLEEGASLYLVKPINKQDLKNAWQYAYTTTKETRVGCLEEVLDVETLLNEDTKSTTSSSVDNGVSPNRSRLEKIETLGKGVKRSRECEEQCHSRQRKRSKVIWTSSLHNQFLQAVNYIGLDKAVPKRILEFMGVPGLTRENVASHLQKYRLFLKKVAEKGLTSSSTISSTGIMRSASIFDSASIYRRTDQEDLGSLLQRRYCNRSLQYTYSTSNFATTRYHSQQPSSLSRLRLREPNSYQAHLLHPRGIRRNDMNATSTLGNLMGHSHVRHGQNDANIHLSKVQDVSSCYNSGISSNIDLDSFGSYYETQPVHSMSHEIAGAGKPSFNADDVSTKSSVFHGNMMSDSSANIINGDEATIDENILSHQDFDNIEMDDILLQQCNVMAPPDQPRDTSTKSSVSHENMMSDISASIINGDEATIGENMLSHQDFDNIEMDDILLQEQCNVVAPSDQPRDGVTNPTLESESSHFDSLEMNNLINELSQPFIFDEPSVDAQQIPTFDKVPNMDEHLTPTNFDGESNLEVEHIRNMLEFDHDNAFPTETVSTPKDNKIGLTKSSNLYLDMIGQANENIDIPMIMQ